MNFVIACWLCLPVVAEGPQWVQDPLGDWVMQLESESCGFQLRYHASERLVHYRSACPESLTRQLKQIVSGLHQLTHKHGFAYETLFIGRMLHYPEMARRLAILAAGETDRPSTRDQVAFYPWVVKACNRARVFAELDQELTRLGMTVEVASVEKVLCAPPKKMPPEIGAGIDSTQPLPYDALTWFRLIPIESGTTP